MTTVLLVDDERLIQRSLEKTLLRAGFDVLTASHFAFLGYQDSGEGSCKFENSWIWELK